MATLEQLKSRTRLELSDLTEPFYESFGMSGQGTRVDLRVENVSPSTFHLYPEGNPAGELVAGTHYVLEPRRGVVEFTTAPAAGARYVAEGDSALLFTDEQIETFVQEAFDLHTRNRNISMDALPPSEVLLVAILAQIEALWVAKASAAYDVNIHAPEGMFIPRGQRFNQLNVLLQEVEQRYRELSAALGVGLYAVEMFNLRRVSRTTGRYVPIYIDREVDDTRPPQRVFPTIGNQFEEMAGSTIPQAHLRVMRGRNFSETFTIEDGVDITDVTARLLRTPYQTSRFRDLLPQPTVTVDGTARTATVTFTYEQTNRLETSGSYVWVLEANEADGEVVPLVQGRVFVEASYPMRNTNAQVGP